MGKVQYLIILIATNLVPNETVALPIGSKRVLNLVGRVREIGFIDLSGNRNPFWDFS